MDINETKARLLKLVAEYGQAEYNRGLISASVAGSISDLRHARNDVEFTKDVLTREIETILVMVAAEEATAETTTA